MDFLVDDKPWIINRFVDTNLVKKQIALEKNVSKSLERTLEEFLEEVVEDFLQISLEDWRMWKNSRNLSLREMLERLIPDESLAIFFMRNINFSRNNQRTC